MLKRLYGLFRNRRPQVTIAMIYAAVLAALTTVFFHESHLEPLTVVIVEIFLTVSLALFVERSTSAESGIAFLLANDLRISLTVSFLFFITAGVWFFAYETGSTFTPRRLLLPAGWLYLAAGLLLGTNLRGFSADLVSRALFGRQRFFTSLWIITLWFSSAAVALLSYQAHALAPFLLGLGCGILLLKGLALRLTRAVAGYRRLFEVQSVPEDVPLPENERKALSLLAAGRHPFTKRFSALRAHLDAYQQRPGHVLSKRLHLLSACAWRLEGRYLEAIEDTKVANDPPIDNLDAQLLLIRALSLEDHGDLSGVIDRLLTTLVAGPPGNDCPLTRALLARRSAEKSIDAGGYITFSKEPLLSVVDSIEMRRGAGRLIEQTLVGVTDEATNFFRGFVAHGVPVTPSWLLDVFGYSLLIAGCAEEARVVLQRCISLDPDYSYGYLHLGDYFLFRHAKNVAGGTRASPGKTGAWHARTCYLLAGRIERSNASRVKRIARSRLDLLDQLDQLRQDELPERA